MLGSFNKNYYSSEDRPHNGYAFFFNWYNDYAFVDYIYTLSGDVCYVLNSNYSKISTRIN